MNDRKCQERKIILARCYYRCCCWKLSNVHYFLLNEFIIIIFIITFTFFFNLLKLPWNHFKIVNCKTGSYISNKEDLHLGQFLIRGSIAHWPHRRNLQHSIIQRRLLTNASSIALAQIKQSACNICIQHIDWLKYIKLFFTIMHITTQN